MKVRIRLDQHGLFQHKVERKLEFVKILKKYLSLSLLDAKFLAEDLIDNYVKNYEFIEVDFPDNGSIEGLRKDMESNDFKITILDRVSIREARLLTLTGDREDIIDFINLNIIDNKFTNLLLEKVTTDDINDVINDFLR